MADYQLKEDGGVIYLGVASIPPDPGNSEWVKYQKWLTLGNTPDPIIQGAKPEDPMIAIKSAINSALTIDQLKTAILNYVTVKGD